MKSLGFPSGAPLVHGLALAFCLTPFGGTGVAASHTPTAADIDWTGVGGSVGEPHYGIDDRINGRSVRRLGLAWSLDLPGEHTLEATPLEAEGTLYFSGQSSAVYAVDAITGTLLWKFDPERSKFRPRHLRLLFPANRGVAYSDGMVFVGTLDGRLIALDAKKGTPIWSVKTVPDDGFYFSTGAPRVVKDKVVIGNGGADAGSRGYVTAYYIKNGEQAWRFYTAPGNPADGFEQPAMKMAASTWSGDWWKTGTGGTVWNGMVFDPELNLLYIGTGNSGPYNPKLRNPGGGDNLFLASIVAINADTGQYTWHYQVNPNEAWDFKATADMILATAMIGGRPRRVVMQAPTNGFFYVLDRQTGKLLSAEKIAKVNWAERIDLTTGRPVETRNIRYADGPFTMWPSPMGAHNWQPMSYSPQTGLVYIPTMELGASFDSIEELVRHPQAKNWKVPYAGATSIGVVASGKGDGTGALLAWDPVAQKAQWKAQYPHLWNGGTLATAGDLVFQGDGEGIFHAYEAKSGRERWHFDAKLGIIAAPITYTIKGIQYISILVGFGGGAGLVGDYVSPGWRYAAQPRRLLTFALDSKASLPYTPPRDLSLHLVDDPALVIDDDAVNRGATAFGGSCAICHGLGARSAGVSAPDLRESSIALNERTFETLLRQGGLESQGMPRFDDFSDAETHDLFMFVRAKAREALGRRTGVTPDVILGGH